MNSLKTKMTTVSRDIEPLMVFHNKQNKNEVDQIFYISLTIHIEITVCFSTQ